MITKGVGGNYVTLGSIKLDYYGNILEFSSPNDISNKIERLLEEGRDSNIFGSCIKGYGYEFHCEDGIKFSESLDDSSIDLVLTDPPYGISKSYICEGQIPRRLRPDGRDFIMPKGNFGEWDKELRASDWVDALLPKVRGWFVSFCAHTQIGEYQNILRDHKFSAIGTIVWYKTNPVPFNAKYKPVNAWEAIVVGKRPGTKFNGNGVIHNVFKHKSPSPQTRIHTTQKPISLLSEFVNLFSDESGIVFDPFSGSGSTIISAVNNKRIGIGCEINPKNYQAACQYIRELANEN